ncbi:MAG: 30S ribosomal protein S10 [Candidatus Poseidoniales archaeon]|nr:30S ribosomal protein S10 [Candidatus Poseidoniales archaeon]
MSITTIKLTGLNHEHLDKVCQGIKQISQSTGVKLRGPIPMPTRRLIVPCRKSPDGEGSETYDHWEMRVHKRLIELEINSTKDEAVLARVVRTLEIPDTVTIEITLRSAT